MGFLSGILKEGFVEKYGLTLLLRNNHITGVLKLFEQCQKTLPFFLAPKKSLPKIFFEKKNHYGLPPRNHTTVI